MTTGEAVAARDRGAPPDTAGPGTAGPERPSPARRLLRGLVVAVFLLAAAGGVALALREQGWEVLARLREPRALPFVLAALAANLAGLALGAWSWRRILVDVSGPVPVADSARIWAVGVFSKYIPGRLWGLLAHVRMGRRAGIPAGRMATVFLVSFGLVMLTGAAVGLLAAPASVGGGAWLLLLPGALLALGVLRPSLVNGLIALLARIGRRPPPESTVSPAGIRAGIGWAVASWLVSGLHLWALAVLVGADPVAALPVGLGGFALGTVAGSAALILPDGWGARELTLMAALATVLPWSEAGVAALASRLICVLAEVGGAGTVLIVTQLRKAR
ncbi:lysylphosphatidylglycerol synthase domain-containing protein [Longispora sp. NPDC051575]|uniref:lysylphosphatidylglycerol synthase domain-containing protein n=1 Tax=Longispora sp. NPDC051575 TaxID=3154943 RepID=UPI003441E42E